MSRAATSSSSGPLRRAGPSASPASPTISCAPSGLLDPRGAVAGDEQRRARRPQHLLRLVRRLALLGERARAFLRVLRRAQELLERFLQAQAVLERHALAADGQLLDCAQRERPVVAEAARVLLGGRPDSLSRGHFIY